MNMTPNPTVNRTLSNKPPKPFILHVKSLLSRSLKVGTGSDRD